MDELIRRRRAQMLVHSYLYYWLDTNIVSDDQWQRWADELASVPYKEIGFYDEAFKDWNGSTGTHLPKDEWVITRASQLLRNIK
jgi:hypothetical protein